MVLICVSANVLIMQNIPSREGYCDVFFIIMHNVTKMCWVFQLRTRESNHILTHLITFVNEVLPSLNIWLRHFHSDGGAELVAAEVLGWVPS